jgi:acetolactate synthase-1/2/3 large subunit
MDTYRFSLGGRSVTPVISCLSDEDTGGGLFALDGNRIEQLDSLSSTGLCMADGRAVRLLRANERSYGIAEMLIYDDRGIERYVRLDSIIDPHDVLWDGTHFVIACSASNRLIWLSAEGKIVREWHAPGEGDCWHLNSLHQVDGRLTVCAFGRFAGHREWTKSSDREGIVFDFESGRDLLRGLSKPHHQRRVDEGWVVCNSAEHELVRITPETGEVEQRLKLNGWTRGLCVLDEVLLVGESSLRRVHSAGAGSVAVVCRKTWKVLDRIDVHCLEIYDIAPMTAGLVEGLRRGFRTNGTRVEEQDQHELFRQAGVRPSRLWALGDPLAPEACRVKVEADAPAQAGPDSRLRLECKVTNEGSAILVSAPPYPVHVAAWWQMPGVDERSARESGWRVRLPHSVPPGEAVRVSILVDTPAVMGRCDLHVTLVQEQVAWFDDLEPSNALVCPMTIATAAIAFA